MPPRPKMLATCVYLHAAQGDFGEAAHLLEASQGGFGEAAHLLDASPGRPAATTHAGGAGGGGGGGGGFGGGGFGGAVAVGASEGPFLAMIAAVRAPAQVRSPALFRLLPPSPAFPDLL